MPRYLQYSPQVPIYSSCTYNIYSVLHTYMYWAQFCSIYVCYIVDISTAYMLSLQAVDDEDPLNSDDDVDDDVGDQKDFETNDTIVCLWEKVRTCTVCVE